MRYSYYRDVSELQGKVLTSVKENSDEILFTTSDNEVYKMFHKQNCCESVYLEDVCGDLQDLVGVPIILAEEFDGEIPNNFYATKYASREGSYTFTFYRFRTIKGDVTLRWFGSSNGYYSESVDFVKVQ